VVAHISARPGLAVVAGIIVVAAVSLAAAQSKPLPEQIYVPGRWDLPSAPTVQAAVDMATGPTDIHVDLKESPGFAAEGKVDLHIGFEQTKVTSSMTFTNCREVWLGGCTTAMPISFDRCERSVLLNVRCADIVVQD
jgi:hypothetical protein